MGQPNESVNAKAWHIARRWFEFEGEIRSALLRVWLVVALFSVQLIHHFFFSDHSLASLQFHRQASIVVAVWLLVSLIVMVSFLRKFFPGYLKFITCGADLILLTVCASLGSGPTSPLVGVFFLLIITAALRCSLELIWFVTLGSLLGYVALVGANDPTWFDANHTTPPVNQLITLTSLAAAGIAAGQLVRMIRQSALEYAQCDRRFTEQATSHE